MVLKGTRTAITAVFVGWIHIRQLDAITTSRSKCRFPNLFLYRYHEFYFIREENFLLMKGDHALEPIYADCRFCFAAENFLIV